VKQTRVRPDTGSKTPYVVGAFSAAVIVLLTVIAYIPAIESGFVWDDNKYVTENVTLNSLSGLAQIWLEPRSSPQYYPLVFTSFWVEYRLWGLDPLGYHAVNVLLQALNALLLWVALKRLRVPGAWLAAAIFAVHPVHVESVAWVTERKNLLSGLFYLASALCLLPFFRLDDHEVPAPVRRRWYGLALVLFMCALLSKTVTCSLPVAMMLLLWWKHGRVGRSDLGALAPFLVLGAVFGAWTAWLESHHVGAEGVEWNLSVVERFLVAGRVLWFYAGKLVWPENLTFTYPRWEIADRISWQYLFPLGVILAVSVLWALRRRIGRGAVVGVLYFIITLFPALGFVAVYPFRFSYVADHFQYLASIGLIAPAVAALTQGASRVPPISRNVAPLSGFLLLVTLSALTWQQGHIYKDVETLWRDTLKKNPAAWHRHYDLATILARKGEVAEAISHYGEALRLKPDYADAHNNLGIALFQKGEIAQAAEQFTAALKLDPRHGEAHYNLAILLAAQGRSEEARQHLSQHLQIRPEHADAHYNLGLLWGKDGKLEEASRHFSEALRIKPDHEEARRNLEVALRLLGKAPAR
jgi:tetratricopeptide (TPR) repeat protein